MFCSILLAACSSNEDTNQDKDQGKEKEEQSAEEVNEQPDNTDTSNESDLKLDSPDLPKNLEEVIAFPIGQYASEDTKVENEDVQNALSSIPSLSEDSQEQELNQLFNYLYSMYKMDYQDPKQVLTSNTIDGPESVDAPEKEIETFNVEIILDSSGSMANLMGSKTRMELAKESIKKFASSLPKEANVSLRVYGHKGTGSDQDKKMSCAANELVYPSQPYNQAGLDQALSSFKPAGWTPLAQSIMEAEKDLAEYTGGNNKNIVYVVSDGIETCGGDPIAAAKGLKDSGVAPVVNIIGFDLGSEDQRQLQEMAKAAGGTYTNVKNQEQLQKEFEETIKESEKWISWKNDQTLGAISNSNNQTMDIIGLANDWHNKNSKEKYLITFSLNDLQMKNKITNSQNNKIIKIMDKFYNQQLSSVEELKKVLLDSTQEDLEGTLEKVDEIYKENVSQ